MITNCGVGIVTDRPLPPRHAHDYYKTDLGTVSRILDKYRHQSSDTRHYQYPQRVLDPGAGSGAWGQIARDFFPMTYLTGCELRDVPKPPDYNEWLVGDFTKLYEGLFPTFHLIMGNPPFSLAEEFVKVGMPLLHKGGHLIFLLRLAFLEGQRRRNDLYRVTPPKAVWVCSKRPSFQEDGKTNATAFAAFVWQQGYEGPTEVGWL